MDVSPPSPGPPTLEDQNGMEVKNPVSKSASSQGEVTHRVVKIKETKKLGVTDLNPHLTCVLCSGYFIDPVTIVECLHSFCKSCIVKHVETSKYCPMCDIQIHKTKPLLSLRADKALQDIVYKVVPGLYRSEMHNRTKFYKSHPDAEPSNTEDAGEGTDRIFFGPEDEISMSIEYFDNFNKTDDIFCKDGGHFYLETENPNRRFLQCAASVKVNHLKKFIMTKYGLDQNFLVDVIYKEDLLPEDHTLIDVAYSYNWRKTTPMRFYYRIYQKTKVLTRKRKKRKRTKSDNKSNPAKKKHLDTSWNNSNNEENQVNMEVESLPSKPPQISPKSTDSEQSRKRKSEPVKESDVLKSINGSKKSSDSVSNKKSSQDTNKVHKHKAKTSESKSYNGLDKHSADPNSKSSKTGEKALPLGKDTFVQNQVTDPLGPPSPPSRTCPLSSSGQVKSTAKVAEAKQPSVKVMNVMTSGSVPNAIKPTPRVTLPTNQVTQPPPKVTQPSLKVTHPPSKVTQPVPKVTLPNIQVSHPTSQVINQPTNKVTQPSSRVPPPSQKVAKPSSGKVTQQSVAGKVTQSKPQEKPTHSKVTSNSSVIGKTKPTPSVTQAPTKVQPNSQQPSRPGSLGSDVNSSRKTPPKTVASDLKVRNGHGSNKLDRSPSNGKNQGIDSVEKEQNKKVNEVKKSHKEEVVSKDSNKEVATKQLVVTETTKQTNEKEVVEISVEVSASDVKKVLEKKKEKDARMVAKGIEEKLHSNYSIVDQLKKGAAAAHLAKQAQTERASMMDFTRTGEVLNSPLVPPIIQGLQPRMTSESNGLSAIVNSLVQKQATGQKSQLSQESAGNEESSKNRESSPSLSSSISGESGFQQSKPLQSSDAAKPKQPEAAKTLGSIVAPNILTKTAQDKQNSHKVQATKAQKFPVSSSFSVTSNKTGHQSPTSVDTGALQGQQMLNFYKNAINKTSLSDAALTAENLTKSIPLGTTVTVKTVDNKQARPSTTKMTTSSAFRMNMTNAKYSMANSMTTPSLVNPYTTANAQAAAMNPYMAHTTMSMALAAQQAQYLTNPVLNFSNQQHIAAAAAAQAFTAQMELHRAAAAAQASQAPVTTLEFAKNGISTGEGLRIPQPPVSRNSFATSRLQVKVNSDSPKPDSPKPVIPNSTFPGSVTTSSSPKSTGFGNKMMSGTHSLPAMLPFHGAKKVQALPKTIQQPGRPGPVTNLKQDSRSPPQAQSPPATPKTHNSTSSSIQSLTNSNPFKTSAPSKPITPIFDKNPRKGNGSPAHNPFKPMAPQQNSLKKLVADLNTAQQNTLKNGNAKMGGISKKSFGGMNGKVDKGKEVTSS